MATLDQTLSQARASPGPTSPNMADELAAAPSSLIENIITQQGWLTKLSRGGFANWNKRWFILIGGSLYYSRSENPTAQQDIQIYTELLHALRIELALPQNGYQFVFKIFLDEEQALVFAAPSNELRLTWLSHIEGSIGMQPVSAAVLAAEIRRDSESAEGGPTASAPTAAFMETALYEKDELLVQARNREESLRHTITQLTDAIRLKDEQLWRLAAALSEHNIPVPKPPAASPALAADAPSTPSLQTSRLPPRVPTGLKGLGTGLGSAGKARRFSAPMIKVPRYATSPYPVFLVPLALPELCAHLACVTLARALCSLGVRSSSWGAQHAGYALPCGA